MEHTNRIKNKIPTGVLQHKKELLTAVFVLLSLSVFPQVTQIKGYEVAIDSMLSGGTSYEITGRDNITFSPGFSFTPSQGNTLITQIDPFYIEPVDTGNITGGPGGDIGEIVGNDGVVGAIPGSFAASPSGAATYTIPIECPSGANGMTPNIALTYNSQAGNGIAGWGWNISGISAISRVQKTIYHDNEAREIQWDSTDVFALDGQRLIEVNYYTDSIEYRLENDPKPKVMGYDCSSGGPGWFKVWDGRGNIYYYSDRNRMRNETKVIYIDAYCSGNDIHDYFEIKTDVVQAFYLSSQCDISGNSIKYEYEYDSTYNLTDTIIEENDTCDIFQYEETVYLNTYKNFRLTGISYGNSANTLYSVEFLYDNRDDSIYGYLAGERFFNSKLLSDITVKYGDLTNGTELKTYSLNYIDTGYSYLQSVELEGLEGERYNKTVFEWEENNYWADTSGLYSFQPPGFYSQWANEGYDIVGAVNFCADFNNDGISDFFINSKFIKGDSQRFGWAIYLNPGEPGYLSKVGEGIFPASRAFYFIDTDMDGKDQLYLQYPHTEYVYNEDSTMMWGYAYVKFKCFEYSDQYNTIIQNESKDFIIRLHSADYDEVHLVAADFEGDGYPDYLLLKNSNNNYVNTKDFSFQCTSSNFGNTTKYQLLDFNGNGKTDILFLHNDKAEIWEYRKNSQKFERIYITNLINKDDIVLTGDFNGDGNSDILYKKYQVPQWNVLISDGKIFLQNILSAPNLAQYNQQYFMYQLCDINQDGKLDVIEKYSDGNYLRVFVQKGNGFSLEIDNLNVGYNISLINQGTYNSDFNTDAFIIDFLAPYDPNRFFYLSISPGRNFNTISGIIDGKGINAEISYGKAESRFYGNPKRQDVNEVKVNYSSKCYLRVVNRIEDEYSTKQYLYERPLIHPRGKGFLGFGKIITKTIIDDVEIQSSSQISKLFWKNNYPYKYDFLPDTVLEKIYDTDVSVRDMNYSTKIIDNTRYIVPDNVIHTDLINNTKTKQFFPNYNDYLLPLTTYTRYYQDTDQLIAVDSTVTTYTNIISGDKRIIGLPEAVTQYKKRPGETDYIRNTDFEYYSNGMLKFKFEEKNTTKELKEEYEYDTYGNTTGIKVSAPNEPGPPLREQAFTYYPNGYHLESKENAMGYTESYTWCPQTGQLKTVTDEENDLTTEYEYDGFGRKIKVAYPDGNETYTGLRWAGGHPDAPDSSLYYAYEQSSGTPPSLVFYDKFGRKLRTVSTGFAGEEIYQDIKYDTKGRIDKQSQPYHPNGDTCRTTYQYDNLNRVSREDYPDGRFTAFNYNVRTLTTTSGRGSDTRQSVQTVNGLGETISSTDNNDNTIETFYYASGLPKEKKVGGSYSTLLSYDIYGNRDTISDPDAGTIASEYNVFGELLSQTDALGNKTVYTYDALGRILTEKQYAPGDLLRNTKTFVYDTRFTGALSSVSQDSAQHSMEYYYDDNGFGRMVRMVETYDGLSLENKYTHDAYGRVKSSEYPSGFKVYNTYNVNGYLKKITGNNKTLWECLTMNPLGQIISHKQGNYTSQTDYDTYGELQSQTFANGRGMNYGFDNKGNMSYREDIHKNLKETFGYDDLDRLERIEYHVNGNHQVYFDRHIEYDNGGIGNISSITGTGSGFNYGENDAGPHALTSVSRPEPGWRPGPQEIKYNPFNKVSSIVDTISIGRALSYEIYYGLDDQRRKSVFKDSGQVMRTKYYFGDYERISENSETKNYHYISSPTGLCAIFVNGGSGGQSQLWHTYTDHLGSLVYMVDADNSNDYKEYSFDAWGNPRDAGDWTDSLSVPLFAGRGFTVHEHLEEFALINMNGRIYDPMLGRFFSPDPYVQLPGYAGSYNRYSYCLNNPLKFSDPDGEIFIPILVGAAISVITNGVNNIMHERSFFHGAGEAALLGGIGGAFSFGIGQLATGMSGFGKLAFQTFAHGHLGGLMTGNSYGSGFLAGGFGSLAATGTYGLLQNTSKLVQGFGMIASGAISGGIGAEISGGEFWDGFRSGFISSALNHVMHRNDPPKKYILPKEGSTFYEGMPTQINLDDGILVVSKESNKYIDINNTDLRKKYLNKVHNGQERYRPRGMCPQTSWRISSVLRVIADPIPNPLEFSNIYNTHYNKLKYNDMLIKIDLYRNLNLIY